MSDDKHQYWKDARLPPVEGLCNEQIAYHPRCHVSIQYHMPTLSLYDLEPLSLMLRSYQLTFV